jgi:hypothetical protein
LRSDRLPTPTENPVGQATNQQCDDRYGYQLGRSSAHSTNPFCRRSGSTIASANWWQFRSGRISRRSDVRAHRGCCHGRRRDKVSGIRSCLSNAAVLILPRRHHTRGGFGYSPRQAALSRAQRPCPRRASSSWRSCAASAWAAVDACSSRSVRRSVSAISARSRATLTGLRFPVAFSLKQPSTGLTLASAAVNNDTSRSDRRSCVGLMTGLA